MEKMEDQGIERVVELMPAIRQTRSGLEGVTLGDAIRRGSYTIVSGYLLASTMEPQTAENRYRDLVAGVSGWY